MAGPGAEHPGRHRGPPTLERFGLSLDQQTREPGRELLAHVHGASVAALRGIEPSLGECACHPDLAGREVDVLPLQAEGLPEAEPGPGQEQEQRLMPPLFSVGLQMRRGAQKGHELLDPAVGARAGGPGN